MGGGTAPWLTGPNRSRLSQASQGVHSVANALKKLLTLASALGPASPAESGGFLAGLRPPTETSFRMGQPFTQRYTPLFRRTVLKQVANMVAQSHEPALALVTPAAGLVHRNSRTLGYCLSCGWAFGALVPLKWCSCWGADAKRVNALIVGINWAVIYCFWDDAFGIPMRNGPMDRFLLQALCLDIHHWELFFQKWEHFVCNCSGGDIW